LAVSSGKDELLQALKKPFFAGKWRYFRRATQESKPILTKIISTWFVSNYAKAWGALESDFTA